MKPQSVHHCVKLNAKREGNTVRWPTYVDKTVVTGQDADGNDVTATVKELKVQAIHFRTTSGAKLFMRTGQEWEK